MPQAGADITGTPCLPSAWPTWLPMQNTSVPATQNARPNQQQHQRSGQREPVAGGTGADTEKAALTSRAVPGGRPLQHGDGVEQQVATRERDALHDRSGLSMGAGTACGSRWSSRAMRRHSPCGVDHRPEAMTLFPCLHATMASSRRAAPAAPRGTLPVRPERDRKRHGFRPATKASSDDPHPPPGSPPPPPSPWHWARPCRPRTTRARRARRRAASPRR